METESLHQIIEMHIKECDGRDARNASNFSEIKGMFKGIWDAQDKMQDAVAKLQVRGGLALGGIIVIGKLLDYYIEFHK